MKINFVHICEKAFFSETKKLCLVEIFNIIASSSFPTTHPSFSLALNFSGEIEKEAEIIILSPSKKELFKVPFNTTSFTEKKESHTVVVNINNFVLPEAGAYKIILRHDGKIVSQERQDVLVVNMS